MVGKIIIAALVFTNLVAFIWLILLYSMPNPTIIGLSIPKPAAGKQLENRSSYLEEQLTKQKRYKNEIRDLWENQAASNDDIVLSQKKTTQTFQDYLNLIKRSIRFISGVPQFYPGVNEAEFIQSTDQVNQSIEDLNKKYDENSKKKDASKKRIDEIYLESQEDQNNEFNPRDGRRD